MHQLHLHHHASTSWFTRCIPVPSMSSKRPKSDKKTTKRPKAEDVQADLFQEFQHDPEFQEFLSVQRNVAKKRKSYAWANDMDAAIDEQENAVVADEGEGDDDDGSKKGKGAKAKKEFIQSEYTVKMRELPYKAKKGEIKRWFSPLTVTRVKLPVHIKGIAYVSFKTKADMEQGLQKHKSILNGHQVLISAHTADEDKKQAEPAPEPKPYHVIQESVADTGRLYVRNLSYTCTSQDLEDLFSPFGQLTEIYLPIDSSTKKVKGFAFVTFMFPEHAIIAMETLDKTKFQERLIHILPGESKPDKFAHFNNLSAFKQKKEADLVEERKKASTWNTLFLGANAAADVMSAKYNVKKSDLIADQTTSDSIAVRMALGETQIVNDTKKFLIENGINLEAFTEEVIHEGVNPNEVQIRKRSKTVILVKNLPVRTASEDLERLFSRYGIVSRVILPVHGVTAIIEMQEEVEAKKAFNSLINYKLNHVPIYLEWAPLQVFTRAKSAGAKSDDSQDATADREGVNDAAPGVRHQVEEGKINPPSSQQQQQREEDGQRKIGTAGMMAEGFRLFVKNISFDTTDESFEEHFKSVGSLLSATIARKKGSAGLSNGYGFVVYKTSDAAEKALKSLQNSMLDGHCLLVQRSHVSRMPPPASSSPAFTACDPAVAPASRGRTGEKMDLTSPGVSLSLHKGKAGGVPAAAAGATASNSQSSGPTAGKLLVRNIPFEASRDEVEQVFSAFPGFKSVRLPKKLASSMGSRGRSGAGSAAGSHRGFAFIEYDTRSGAEKALESLSASTHLYGRRLVLEWAKAADEDDAGPGESLYDKSRVIGSDAGQEGMMARRFKKSNLNSSLRSVSAAASGDVRVDPLDCNPLA